jgi:DNA replication protein DnaC
VPKECRWHLAATQFFRLVCERYERGSIVLTSNKRFAEWGELIGDETLATGANEGR